MKLRNLLLTAALFLTAGIASAAVVHDTANGANSYYWEKDAGSSKNSVTVRLAKPGGNNWHYFLVSMDGPEWETELNKGVQSVDLQGSTKVAVRAFFSNGKEKDEKICFSGDNTPTHNGKFSFIGNASANQIVFGKNGEAHGLVSFGSPLPAPVVTLLIALGFGAALVMYRNRKQEIA